MGAFALRGVAAPLVAVPFGNLHLIWFPGSRETYCMKVILTRDVPRVGKDGEVVVVANGYARNYLFTRQLAVPARGVAVRDHQNRLDREREKTVQLLSAAQQNAAKIEGISLDILARTAPKSNRLFGSVTEADVAQALHEATGLEVDKRKISLIDPIKLTGSYALTVKLHTDVTAAFTVDVITAEQREARDAERAAVAAAAAKAAAEAAAAEEAANAAATA